MCRGKFIPSSIIVNTSMVDTLALTLMRTWHNATATHGMWVSRLRHWCLLFCVLYVTAILSVCWWSMVRQAEGNCWQSVSCRYKRRMLTLKGDSSLQPL
jgi:hypothetical protein